MFICRSIGAWGFVVIHNGDSKYDRLGVFIGACIVIFVDDITRIGERTPNMYCILISNYEVL